LFKLRPEKRVHIFLSAIQSAAGLWLIAVKHVGLAGAFVLFDLVVERDIYFTYALLSQVFDWLLVLSDFIDCEMWG